MPKRHHNHPIRQPLQRRFINKAIIAVAATQPLGTIPQIVTVFQHRDGSSLSISSWAIYILFDFMWLWYGVVEKQKAVIVSAVMFTLMEGAVLLGALLYGGRW
ncbi:MAG TPA: hypothetical protein VLI54_00840 [Bacillota bacterium]|nr:hypothetical protein [Bacillota bacterium]